MAIDERLRQTANMGIAIIFILGIGNFALHQAVLNSKHPLLGRMPWFVHMLGGKATLITEFLVLLAAMLMVANGWPQIAWAYAIYTGLNAGSAWLILSGRI